MWSSQAAIDWPRACKFEMPSGTIRSQFQDFRVEEVLNCEFSNDGEHLYLQIEKTDENTQDVQKLLAKHYKVPLIDVSYSGMKDKRAVTQQWFSIRLPNVEESPRLPNIKILQERQHRTKLRRGTHSSNRFDIVVRDLVAPADHDFARALNQPFPNYFGPQRFGYEFNNLNRAVEWVKAGRRRTSRIVRSRHLSTLRSFLFNEVLAQRIRTDTWNRNLPGDCVQNGTSTGPLWGRGTLATTDVVLEIEQGVRHDHEQICDALEWVGLNQERRSLAIQAKDVCVVRHVNTLKVSLTLPPGTYATAALNETLQVSEHSR